MAKESLYHIDKSVVFRETFNNELAVRKNGGVNIGNVVFENGVALTSSGCYIDYKLNYLTKNGSIRIKLKNYVAAGSQYIYWTSGDKQYVNISSGFAGAGTEYVNGVLADNLPNGDSELVVTGIDLTGDLTIGNINTHGTTFDLSADIELIEIYNRVLTATEVALLHNKSLYTKPATFRQATPSFYSNAQAYGDLGNFSEYEIQDFEVYLIVHITPLNVRNELFAISHNINAGDLGGFTIRYQQTPNNRISVIAHGGNTRNTPDNSIVLGFNHIRIIKYSTTLLVFINNNEFSLIDLGIINYTNLSKASYINAYNNNGTVGVFNQNPYYIKVKYYELDSSGNRIKQLINLDFNQQSGTTIPNVAADAPASSDGTVIPNGQATDSWWQQYDGYKEVFNLDLTRGIIPSTDKYGNSVTNNGVKSKKVGKVSSGWFDGSSDFLIPFSIDLNSNYIISLWANITGYTGNRIFNFSDANASDPRISLIFDNNRFVFQTRNNTPISQDIDIIITPKLNTWYHCVLGSQNNTIFLRINLTTYSDRSITGTFDGIDQMSIGVLTFNGGSKADYTKGFIPIVKIYQGIPADPAAFAAREYNANKYKFGL